MECSAIAFMLVACKDAAASLLELKDSNEQSQKIVAALQAVDRSGATMDFIRDLAEAGDSTTIHAKEHSAFAASSSDAKERHEAKGTAHHLSGSDTQLRQFEEKFEDEARQGRVFMSRNQAANRIQHVYRMFRQSHTQQQPLGDTKLSANRISYSLGDLLYPITRALSGEEGSKLTATLFERYTQGAHKDPVMTKPDFDCFMNDMIGAPLKQLELRALYNICENSNDEVTVKDVHQFLSSCSGAGEMCYSVKTSAAVTTVGFSLDKRFLAAGSCDGQVKVYKACGEQVFQQRMNRPVGDLAMSSRGDFVAIGCHGGLVVWIRISDCKVMHTWDTGHDCCAIAVNFMDTELAVAGRNQECRVYSLDSSRGLMYTFNSPATVLSVSLARKETFSFALSDGTQVQKLANLTLFDSAGAELDSNDSAAVGLYMDARIILAEGIITDASEEIGVANAWTACLDALDSLQVMAFMLSIVLIGTVLSLPMVKSNQMINYVERGFLAIFVIEMLLRLSESISSPRVILA